MHAPTGRLLALVHELDALGNEPTLAALGHALQGANLTLADVQAYVRPTPRTYNRVPVVVRAGYDLLVMTWLPGQASLPHDHSGSICATWIVQGEAVEGCYQIAPDGYVDLQYETPAGPGALLAGQDSSVHTLRNTSAHALLVSVHIYAPPLRDVRQFRQRPQPVTGIYQSGPPTVVVVGAGFSGTMTAAQTLRKARRAGQPVRVVLVERRGSVGEGLAYGTRELVHLLNVPAGRMSAWPDRPDDFVHWAAQRDPHVKAGDFLPRAWYGEYVREVLLKEAAGGELVVVYDEVRRVSRHPGGGWMVHLAREASVRSDAVVLTVGHRPPSDPLAAHWTGPRTRFIGDPWRPFATNVVGSDDPVVILGSGLTAVDTVLSLCQQQRSAPITLVSRNGLLPHAHALPPLPPVDLTAAVNELLSGAVQALDLLRLVRGAVRSAPDWRCVVDGLRPHTARLWQALSASERVRFLSRLRPLWEVHRHRMARAVAEPFQALVAAGQVRLVAGRVATAGADEEGVKLTVLPRGGAEPLALNTAWVINCTGPLPSNSVESNPVVGSLLVSGIVRPDELGLGIETTADGSAVAADGSAVSDLLLVGTLRKPADWESTAVPELRTQAAGVADALLRVLAACATATPARRAC